MLACKKCRSGLTERIAHQSLSEIEATLAAQDSQIAAHRKAMNKGPLCDPCLACWQEEYKEYSSRKSIVLDTRSPAIRRLDEACLRLTPQSQ